MPIIQLFPVASEIYLVLITRGRERKDLQGEDLCLHSMS